MTSAKRLEGLALQSTSAAPTVPTKAWLLSPSGMGQAVYKHAEFLQENLGQPQGEEKHTLEYFSRILKRSTLRHFLIQEMPGILRTSNQVGPYFGLGPVWGRLRSSGLTALYHASVKARRWAWGLKWRQMRLLARENSLFHLLTVLHCRSEKGRPHKAQATSPGCACWWWQWPLPAFTVHAGCQLVPLTRSPVGSSDGSGVVPHIHYKRTKTNWAIGKCHQSSMEIASKAFIVLFLF